MSQMNKIEVNGKIRSFDLVVPSDTSKKSALLIALHGFSGNAKTIERISNLSDYAKKYNFYVIFPNGFGTDKNVLFSWNAKFCCGDAQKNNSQDVLFIKTLIEHMKSTYLIDEHKILVTGISNGAMMTHRIGIELGGLVTGIIAVAGAIGTVHPHPFQHEISHHPIDVIIFHGLHDNFIPFNGDKGVTPDPNTFFPVYDQVKYWVKVNKCEETPIKEDLANGQVLKETFTSQITNKKVIYYLIKEGTHTWPGGSTGLKAAGVPVPKEICDASQIIVDFFIASNQ